jgi:hypothetical protein
MFLAMLKEILAMLQQNTFIHLGDCNLVTVDSAVYRNHKIYIQNFCHITRRKRDNSVIMLTLLRPGSENVRTSDK